MENTPIQIPPCDHPQEPQEPPCDACKRASCCGDPPGVRASGVRSAGSRFATAVAASYPRMASDRRAAARPLTWRMDHRGVRAMKSPAWYASDGRCPFCDHEVEFFSCGRCFECYLELIDTTGIGCRDRAL